jgi:hypothetical protein
VLDASLLKEFHVTERKYFQVRFETFNTLNRPGFGTPNLSPTSSSFGLITSTVPVAHLPAQPKRKIRAGGGRSCKLGENIRDLGRVQELQTRVIEKPGAQ